MRVTVIGVMKGQNKNGKEFMQIFATKPFSTYESQTNQCLGLSVHSEFTYGNYDLTPGDEVELKYEPGYQGKATLVDIEVLKKK